MNIQELHSFQISDAVTFHDELNPKLWNNNNLRPEVKKQLELVAQDFLSELGVDDLDVHDITVSGSNAAYSYTPHSDLDLHILVDMSKLDNNEIYKELFHAKKNIYNDTHNILIHGVPVELYVQDARKPVTSLGEYSIKDNKWLRLPTKRRANFDQNATKAKYEKLLELIQHTLGTRKLDKVQKTIKKITQYRQAGLDNGGEFGPENLAYKALRSQGYITKLYDLRDQLHSEVLTIETMYQDPVKIQEANLAESFRNEFTKQLDESQEEDEIHNYTKLDHTLAKLCKLVIKGQESTKDYGMVAACVIDPSNNFVTGLNIPGSDVKRVHAERVAIEKYEREYGNVPEGSIIVTTLSPCNEQHDDTAETRVGESCTDFINSKGIRKVYCGYTDPTQDNDNREFNIIETSNKELRAICKTFADTFLKENDTMQFASEKTPPVSPYAGLKDTQFRGGISEAVVSNFVYHVTPTKNLKSIAKQGLVPTIGDRSSQIAGEKSGIYVFPDRASAEDAVMNWLGDEFDDEPLTMLKIDVSGLDKHITKGADYELIVGTTIEPSRIKRVNVQLEEASGYIPSEKQKNDPRFKTALTVDVHPDSIKKNAKAFYWTTSRAGIPPTAKANGKIS